jgi:hypothetical protein
MRAVTSTWMLASEMGGELFESVTSHTIADCSNGLEHDFDTPVLATRSPKTGPPAAPGPISVVSNWRSASLSPVVRRLDIGRLASAEVQIQLKFATNADGMRFALGGGMPKRRPIPLAFTPNGTVLVHAELVYGEQSTQALLRRANLDGRRVFVGVELDAAQGGLLQALENAAAEAAARSVPRRRSRGASRSAQASRAKSAKPRS